MADNNNVLTIVLVVAAVLLFSGNLTGNAGKAVPGSQVAAWCEDPYDPGNFIASGDYQTHTLENNLVSIVSCDSTGTARITACPDVALALGSNKAILNVQDITTHPNDYGCRAGRTTGVSNTLFPEQF